MRRISNKVKKYRKKLMPFVIGALILLIPLFFLTFKRSEKVLADSLLSFDEGYGTSPTRD